MKKLIISITLLFCGLIIYGQIPAPTTPQTLNNGEQMLIIRTKTNTNFTNIGAYAARLKDTLNAHNIRLLALEDSSMSFDTRLGVLEAGGTGTGETYTFINGLTNTLGNVGLGGTLNSNVTFATGNYVTTWQNLTAPPTTGTRVNNFFSNTSSHLSNYTYTSGVLTAGSSIQFLPIGGFSLYGRYTKDSWIYNGPTGLHFEYDISSSPTYRTMLFSSNGLSYGADYSADFTSRSLVDVGYVTDYVADQGIGESVFQVTDVYPINDDVDTVAYEGTARAFRLQAGSPDNYAAGFILSELGPAGIRISVNHGTPSTRYYPVSMIPLHTMPITAAYDFTTFYDLSNDYKIFSIGNNILTREEIMYVKADSISFLKQLLLPYLGLATGDTSALVAVGSTERIVAMPLVPPASRGWEIKLPSYLQFYLDSKKHKALPLTYPDLGTPELHGQDRREINKMHGFYQVEFELERLHRFLFRQWTENKLQWIVILLLSIGFLKQRKEIKLLKSKI